MFKKINKKIIDGFMIYAPAIISKTVRIPNHCILSTAITIDVMRNFGIQATPMPVKVEVFDPVTTKSYYKKMVKKPNTNWTPRDAVSSRSHIIFIGYGNGKSPAVGHLVSVLDIEPEPGVLIDLSVTQASRPEKGINIRPLVSPVTSEFRSFKEVLIVETEKPNNCILLYNPDPNNSEIFNSGDWIDKKRREQIVKTITFAIDEYILGNKVTIETKKSSL